MAGRECLTRLSNSFMFSKMSCLVSSQLAPLKPCFWNDSVLFLGLWGCDLPTEFCLDLAWLIIDRCWIRTDSGTLRFRVWTRSIDLEFIWLIFLFRILVSTSGSWQNAGWGVWFEIGPLEKIWDMFSSVVGERCRFTLLARERLMKEFVMLSGVNILVGARLISRDFSGSNGFKPAFYDLDRSLEISLAGCFLTFAKFILLLLALQASASLVSSSETVNWST